MSRLTDFVAGCIIPKKAVETSLYAVITYIISPPKKVRCSHRFNCKNYELAKKEGLWEFQKELCNKHADDCIKYQKFSEEEKLKIKK